MVLNNKKITIPKEVMAGQILPFLMPMSIENALTLNQFNAVMSVVKNMVNMVETEHRAKLEQLSSIQEQQKFVSKIFFWVVAFEIDTSCSSMSRNLIFGVFENLNEKLWMPQTEPF